MEAGTESKRVSTLTELVQREDFQATSDPALEESAEKGKAQLLDYRELYEL